MTDAIRKKLEYLKSGVYKQVRRNIDLEFTFPADTHEFYVNSFLLKHMCDNETPILFPNDRFGFNRTIIGSPSAHIGDRKIPRNSCGNVTPNYEYVLSVGMDTIADRIKQKLSACEDGEKKELYQAMLGSIEAALSLSDRYRELAKKEGAKELYEALCQVPRGGAKSFHQACVFLKFIQVTLRYNRNSHVTLGGFDKYMFPYFKADLERGVSEQTLFDILEDFFITLNLDSDLYFGVQQGDNGMSMVLGGRDMDWNDRYNLLSEMCLKASTELCIIDPKINLRVDKDTPLSRLELATELTKNGLGFPQYSNDDVVIKGLLKLGYAKKDAYDYTVAACWEFISPGNGFDVPNMGVINFPRIVEQTVNTRLCEVKTFEEFLAAVKQGVADRCRARAEYIKDKRVVASPYLSVFIDDCIERGLDVSQGGAIYNNYGAQGVGISNAADAIAAVKQVVFDTKKYSAEELVEAINADFDGYNELRNYLISCPKMGNNDDAVDGYASILMDVFSEEYPKHKNCHGGIMRPGTGSAMEYLWSASKVGATADGRKAGTPFGSSFSPSPIAKLDGPLSCIKSFTKYDLSNIINGGPLTMEIHDNTFRNEDGIKKVAFLVKTFIERGGHQLQLNSVNRETLLDAQKHPEDHKNLIVRVWGWSGYFNELSVEYQNHIISRTEYMI
jgi:formate C-acetyltransferase